LDGRGFAPKSGGSNQKTDRFMAILSFLYCILYANGLIVLAQRDICDAANCKKAMQETLVVVFRNRKTIPEEIYAVGQDERR
jgi:hypothetical protein